MSPEANRDVDNKLAGLQMGSLQRGRMRYFPVVPGRVEFAAALRRLLLKDRPTTVAVELPGFLEDAYRGALLRLPELSVILYESDSDDALHDAPDGIRSIYVPIEPADPFVEALRTAKEIGAEIVFLEPDSQERPHLHDAFPDTYAVQRVGIDRYVESYRLWPQERTEEITTHAAGMAWKLQGVDPNATTVVVVSLNLLDPLLDAMEMPQEPPPRAKSHASDVQLLNPHPDCLAEITVEYPYLQERYEFFRISMADGFTEDSERLDKPRVQFERLDKPRVQFERLDKPRVQFERLDKPRVQFERLDKPRVQMDLLREASEKYTASTGDKIVHWHRRLMARFTRNLANMNGELVAGAYDLAVAARSIVDDNYGWEVWQMANRYLAQQAVCELETVRLSGGEIWLNTKRLRIQRRLPRPKQRLKPAGLKPRKKESTPGEWAKQTSGNAICSYPPEDLVIEEYGRFLKKKAKALLSEDRVRVEPFTTSLLDGIDIRETIRNWHEKKIYVRQADRLAGQVGSVVVVFDEDRDGVEDHYPYLTTWLGEHQNESDMAFYSTEPFANIVGPGIGRAEYGGLLMTLPPRRMYDVWSDADYDFAETKAERLLMAGLDYSTERFVVYVAAKPPRSIFRSIASHINRKILYVPIGQLSPTKMKRLRVVHVLDGYERREQAKDYIW